MPWFRLRPTFTIALAESRDLVLEKIGRGFPLVQSAEQVLLYGDYGELHLPPAEHRLWSPHLSWNIQEDGAQSRLYGRFAPRVNVWCVVWIVYLLAVFTLFFALVIGATQQLVGHYPWGYWLAVGSALVWFGVYAAAQIGQQLSADQMEHLRQQLLKRLSASQVTVIDERS